MGPGSGGGYYAFVRGNYTLASGVAITLTGGVRRTFNGGDGRFTIFNTGTVTIDGTIMDGVATYFQLYPAVPLGGLLVGS